MKILKFVSTVIEMGDKMIVIIPKKSHGKVKPYVRKQVKITLEEI